LQDPWAVLLGVLVSFAALMGYLGWVAHSLGRSLVRTVEAVRHGTELMTTVNPDHRLEVRIGDELEALAEDVNRLADDLRKARLEVETRVAAATTGLVAERRKLAAILEELAEGVVVTGLDGRITLANRVAQELLRVSIIGRHSALGDALTTAEILVRLLELLKRRGLPTLGQVLDALKRSGRRR
jgi:DNA polymerase-3 subunit epsilon